MWQSFIYGIHWRHQGRMYYDEVKAGSKAAAAGYFNQHKRDDVTLVWVELMRPEIVAILPAFDPQPALSAN